MQPVLINGQWRDSAGSDSFQAENPATCELLPDVYPVSSWEDCEAALAAATAAAEALWDLPPTILADFLEAYASRIEERAEELVEMAHLETALPKSPRLADI